jgi:formate dehydrogenase subunit gamma
MFTLFQASPINEEWRGAVVFLGLVAGGMTLLGLLINYLIVMNLKPATEQPPRPLSTVRRYSKLAIVLHWTYAAAFITLLATGIALFIPDRTQIPSGSPLSITHIVAGIVAIVVPLVYALANPASVRKGLKSIVTWGKEDLEWMKAAPLYYYLFDEQAMPPQGYLNTFQKMWLLLVIICGFILAVSGIILGFWGNTASTSLLSLTLFVHDIAFITVGTMFIVHVYLTVVHPMAYPLSSGSWSAITRGTVSSEYAQSHHSKWYDEVIRTAEKSKKPE